MTFTIWFYHLCHLICALLILVPAYKFYGHPGLIAIEAMNTPLRAGSREGAGGGGGGGGGLTQKINLKSLKIVIFNHLMLVDTCDDSVTIPRCLNLVVDLKVSVALEKKTFACKRVHFGHPPISPCHSKHNNKSF